MASATIYLSAHHKVKENYGCFSISLLKKNAKKAIEKVGQFDSPTKNYTQLSTLIYSLSFLESSTNIEDVIVYTEFALVKIFTDGSVFDWHKDNWAKPDGSPNPEADLWDELFSLVVNYNISFETPDKDDEKMKAVLRTLKNESKRPKKTQGVLEETTKTNKAEPIKVEAKKVAGKKSASQSSKLEKEAEMPKVEEKVLVKEETKEESKVTPMESLVKSKTTAQDTISIDLALKAECEKLFGQLGLPLEVAVTLFLKHSLRKNGLTLDLKLEE